MRVNMWDRDMIQYSPEQKNKYIRRANLAASRMSTSLFISPDTYIARDGRAQSNMTRRHEGQPNEYTSRLPEGGRAKYECRKNDGCRYASILAIEQAAEYFKRGNS